MIKIFKKGLTASEGCRWGLSGSWYGCCRFIRGFGWVCVAAEICIPAVLYTEENRKALEGGNLHEKENEQKKEPQREHKE